MGTTITWLHLSDLHCCPARTGWDANRILEALAKDLEELANKHEIQPDFLFFTGDAAFGHLPDEGLPIGPQLDDAARFFERIRGLCGIAPENVFLVPGNHDIDRTRIVEDDTAWLEACRKTYGRDAVHELIRQGDGKMRWRSVMARLDAYRAFLERNGYEHLLQDLERLIYIHRRNVQGIEVGIAGLNSAWSCRGDDRGRLWLAGEWQVATLENELAETELRIGLVHHPLSWLVDAEAPDLEPLFERVFDFHLHGHEHKAWVKPLVDSSVCIASGACYDRSDRANGYNLMRLDFESGKGEVWLRYYERDSGFWQKRELRGKTDAQGVWHLDGLRCFERRRSAAFTGAEKVQPSSEKRLLDGVFDALARNPILMLLAQNDRVEREVIAGILERAWANRGATGTYHVTPPASSEATLREYFNRLGRQCGFAKDVMSPTQWEDELDYRLNDGERLFLLVSGFEKGSPEGCRQLGAVLRALSERHGQSLWVVLCGGEQLAALKYEDGGSSVLNSAERHDWPEPTVEDILVWQQEFPGVGIDRLQAEELLELCGGHPRLVRFCLERRQRSETESEREALTEYDMVWNLFTPHLKDPEARRRICAWLEQDDLGRFHPWHGDALLRRLYWSNALAVRGKKLRWRCEVVRDVGRQALECG